MAVAAPARRSSAIPAPAPSRTTAPPRRRPAPARKPAPVRKPAPARKPARGQLIPLAVGRTAVAVSQLPDSGLVVRMTRGRAWIGVLGVLLAGIVALNVITLSFAASSGKIGEDLNTLEAENSILQGRDARLTGVSRVRVAADQLGLAMPASEDIEVIAASRRDVAIAAQRLAAAGPG